MVRIFRRGKDRPSDNHEGRMPLLAHVIEMRDRLIKVFLALIVGTTIGFIFAGDVLDFMRTPYCQIVQQPADCQLVILGPTGGVIAYFRISLLIGAILAIPITTYHILMFALPALEKPSERRTVLMALPAITLLFLGGVAFAWYILMPPALGFLQGFEPTLFKPEWTADLYLSFTTSLIFWMGVAFEMPLIFFVIALLGMIRPKTLINNWRVAIVLASVAAALITPTIDPVNMFLVMAPLLGLYILSIFTVWLGRRFSNVAPDA